MQIRIEEYNFIEHCRFYTEQTKDFDINSVNPFLPAGLSGDLGSVPECRPALRGLGMSRAEDLRAELLRAEHLKAEALWEENSDGSR